MHKLGNIRKMDGKRFKAVDFETTKGKVEKKAKIWKWKWKHVRVIKEGNEWYIYVSGKMTVNVKPNLTPSQIKKQAKEVGKGSPYLRGEKAYLKGNWGYMVDGRNITAIYKPSMKKPLKIMYKWKKNKWENISMLSDVER